MPSSDFAAPAWKLLATDRHCVRARYRTAIRPYPPFAFGALVLAPRVRFAHRATTHQPETGFAGPAAPAAMDVLRRAAAMARRRRRAMAPPEAWGEAVGAEAQRAAGLFPPVCQERMPRPVDRGRSRLRGR